MRGLGAIDRLPRLRRTLNLRENKRARQRIYEQTSACIEWEKAAVSLSALPENEQAEVKSHRWQCYLRVNFQNEAI